MSGQLNVCDCYLVTGSNHYFADDCFRRDCLDDGQCFLEDAVCRCRDGYRLVGDNCIGEFIFGFYFSFYIRKNFYEKHDLQSKCCLYPSFRIHKI